MAQQLPEDFPGPVHLGGKVRTVEPREGDVVVGVNADLVALGVHSADEVLIALNLGADEKEGSVDSPLGKTVQQGGGGGAAGAVVKGEGDELGRRLLFQLRRSVCLKGGFPPCAQRRAHHEYSGHSGGPQDAQPSAPHPHFAAPLFSA